MGDFLTRSKWGPIHWLVIIVVVTISAGIQGYFEATAPEAMIEYWDLQGEITESRMSISGSIGMLLSLFTIPLAILYYYRFERLDARFFVILVGVSILGILAATNLGFTFLFACAVLGLTRRVNIFQWIWDQIQRIEQREE